MSWLSGKWISTYAILVIPILSVVVYLCTQDVATDMMREPHPSTAAVVQFYDLVGGILMNDYYHWAFEEKAMDEMIEHCGLRQGQTILEVGPGSGFLGRKVLQNLTAEISEGDNNVTYIGVDMSRTMYDIATQTLKPYIDAGVASLYLTNDTFGFISDSDLKVDRVIFTYVLDLLPTAVIDKFASLWYEKLQLHSTSKVCVVNLTYGQTYLSRFVTNVWLVLYRVLGGEYVGGCRPIRILDFFRVSDGYQVEYKSNVVSFGLPSEVVVLSIQSSSRQ